MIEINGERHNYAFPTIDFLFQNTGTTTALLWQFAVEVLEAEIDSTPDLVFHYDVPDGTVESRDVGGAADPNAQLVISATNIGWGPARKLEIAVDEAELSRAFSKAERTFTGEIDGATTQEILRLLPRRRDAPRLQQRRSQAPALPMPKRPIGTLELRWKARDSAGRRHGGRASVLHYDRELYLTPTGFLCVRHQVAFCLAHSESTYCTMIDPDRGAHQRLYPIARKIPPGDVERFHILIGATKSSRLRLRFKFWVDTSRTVESAVFNVQIHNPFNSGLHHDYVDGEELLRRDAEIEQAELRRSALKEAAERGWLVFDQAAVDPAGRRYYLTRPGMSGGDGARAGLYESHVADKASPPSKKHTILFLAGNPVGTDQRALEREARAIQVELERSGCRGGFEFVTRWAVEPLDLLRELRKLKPTVVHFSGSGGENVAGADAMAGAAGDGPYDETPSRDITASSRLDDDAVSHGLFFEGPGGRPQLVSTTALEETFRAAGASVKVVVLNACYSEVQAEALRAHVDCVVGMGGSVCGDATRNFAIGFYGGLGERESVAAAFKQGCAAIHLDGLRDADRPRLKIRDGIDPDRLVLASDQGSRTTHVHRNIFSDPYSEPVFTLVARWTSEPTERKISELKALFPLMSRTEVDRARKGFNHEKFTIGRFTESRMRDYASQLESLGVELERIPVIWKRK